MNQKYLVIDICEQPLYLVENLFVLMLWKKLQTLMFSQRANVVFGWSIIKNFCRTYVIPDSHHEGHFDRPVENIYFEACIILLLFYKNIFSLYCSVEFSITSFICLNLDCREIWFFNIVNFYTQLETTMAHLLLLVQQNLTFCLHNPLISTLLRGYK